MKLLPRVCAGCGRGLGTVAILGAYWHPACYRKATEEERAAARRATAEDPESLLQPRRTSTT